MQLTLNKKNKGLFNKRTKEQRKNYQRNNKLYLNLKTRKDIKRDALNVDQENIY